MKRNINILATCLTATILFCAACDESDNNVQVSTETFPVGNVTWSGDVTAQEKEVISDLINSMRLVEETYFWMGAQSRSYARPNYVTGYTNKDTIWDATVCELNDTLTRHGEKKPYEVVYYNNGIAVGPVTQVAMQAYYIGSYEVTQAQWNAVMNRKPTGTYCKVEALKGTDCWFNETGLGDNVAAYNISYDDAVEFCKRLHAKTGLLFRLPTEAEWECAARGGKASRGYKYAGSDEANPVSWNYYNACANGLGSENYGVHAVGEKDPNELGLYDMSGNVSEWVANSYYLYTKNDTQNPQGAAPGDTLILRGGSWTQTRTMELCTGNRKKFVKSSYSEQSFLDAIAYCGFRIALSK